MRHPLQRNLARSSASLSERILVAAAGPRLLTYRLSDGGLVSSWTNEVATPPSTLTESRPSPSKRRKLSVSEKSSSQHYVGRRQPSACGPSVITLAFAHGGHHVITASDDDKCIRVFGLDDGGHLELLNERFVNSIGLWLYNVDLPQINAQAPLCNRNH